MSAYTRSNRPLFSGWSALGLTAAAGVAFASLLPLTRERESRALVGTPDMLALAYLSLSLERAPHDPALRLRVAERTLAAGQFEQARQVLAPLLERGAAASPDAELLRVEIAFREWAAAEPARPERRRQAQDELVATLSRTHHERLTPLGAERVASLCEQTGLFELRALILGQVAGADLENDARLAAADAAYLAAEAPLDAARLLARRALEHPDKNGAEHAARALSRALAAGQPGEALVLFRKLRRRYPTDPHVLELGLGVLAGIDDVEALSVARKLIEARPGDVALRRRISELEAWTHSGRATPRPESARRPLDWEGSEALAVALDSPRSPGEVVELTALLESLGAPNRALRLLNAAIEKELVDERSLWDVKVGVQLRMGEREGAIETLAQMDARFGATRQNVQRRADLLLSLGRLGEALELLDTAPGPRATEDVRRVSALAWELGHIPRVRAAYRVIARSPEATQHDYRRLWLLEREAGDLLASARVALAGWQRFRERDFLSLALHTAVASGDEPLLLGVLAETRAAAEELGHDPEDFRLQVDVLQARAHQALRRGEHGRARAELERSARLLGDAHEHAPHLGAAYGELWDAQRRQVLELALASDDRETLARVYPEQAKQLTPRQRVHVLHRLGRDEDAVSEAVSNIQSGELTAPELDALQDDAGALSAEMPRQVGVLSDVLEMESLTAVRVGANARFTWSEGQKLGAQVELTRLGSWDSPSLYLSGRDELAVELHAGLAASALTLGVVTLDGRAPRPLARFEQGVHDGALFDLSVGARLNDRSRDTPELRVLGVEDELAATASLSLFEQFTATGRGSAKLYSDRDRQYLGSGLTFDASLGRYWALPDGWGQGNVRVAGYVAPRFAANTEAPVPDGTSFLGAGASWTRGQLSVAPVAGRRLSVLADVTAGWLIPQDDLGWSSKLGLGISVLGADQLSIAASASNVVSMSPGFSVYTLGADYALSQW